MYFKNQPLLATAPLVPARPFRNPLPGGTLGAMAQTFNRIGGLVQQLSAATGIDAVAVLAVWLIETGGRACRPEQALLRFEVHQFYRHWGRANEALFDRHFQFGGHAGTAGKNLANHRMREDPAGTWSSVHSGKLRERAAFALAERLGGTEAAALASRFGWPQIMGCHHTDCGYPDAASLRAAFNADERWQALGFFDFCASNALLDLIRTNQWKRFGQAYNGDGDTYGPKLADAWAHRDALLALPRD